MLLLSLDSTSPAGSVALWREGAVLDVRAADPRRAFSEQLPGALIDLLERHGLRLRDVDVLAVASGPGSLTGLRVGIATVQGLALAADKPVVAVSALEATARAACDGEGPPAPGDTIAPWRDARRGEVFACLYGLTPVAGRPGLVEIEPPSVGSPEDTLKRWHDRGLIRGGLLLAGDAALDGRERAVAILGRPARAVPGSLLAGSVASIAAERAARGETVRPHAVQPLYVRRPDAVLARERSLGSTADVAPRACPGVPGQGAT